MSRGEAGWLKDNKSVMRGDVARGSDAERGCVKERRW